MQAAELGSAIDQFGLRELAGQSEYRLGEREQHAVLRKVSRPCSIHPKTKKALTRRHVDIGFLSAGWVIRMRAEAHIREASR